LFFNLSLHTKRRDQSASFDMDISTMAIWEEEQAEFSICGGILPARAGSA
jgi:hypothetical protein